MSLTLPIEEFVKFHVQAKIGPGNGAIAFNVSPSKEGALFPAVPSGMSVHFKTVVEKGVNVLSISTSFDGEERRLGVEEHDTVHHKPSSDCALRHPLQLLTLIRAHMISQGPPRRRISLKISLLCVTISVISSQACTVHPYPTISKHAKRELVPRRIP
ncbi:hypothetical protein C8R47DRAFT_1135277 [Mycena vitilis]|nr:hypothetical protein C8R47DRAFT_1135277 [Mycena vitilis]